MDPSTPNTILLDGKDWRATIHPVHADKRRISFHLHIPDTDRNVHVGVELPPDTPEAAVAAAAFAAQSVLQAQVDFLGFEPFHAALLRGDE